MKYTDKEYVKALEELKDLIDDIQTADQIVYKSPLDDALSDAGNAILDELDKR